MKQPLVIERPELQSRAQRLGFSGITLFFWAAWFYLIVPVLSFGAWLLGANVVYLELIVGLDIEGLADKVQIYGPALLGLVAMLLLWAVTSLFRFSGQDRRQPPKLPGIDEVAAAHGISTDVVKKLRRAKNVTLPATFLEHVFNVQADQRPSSSYRGDGAEAREAAEVVHVNDHVRDSAVPAEDNSDNSGAQEEQRSA